MLEAAASAVVANAHESTAQNHHLDVVRYLFTKQDRESMSFLKQVVIKSLSVVVLQLLAAVPTIPTEELQQAMAFALDLNELQIGGILSNEIDARSRKDTQVDEEEEEAITGFASTRSMG